MSGLILYPYSYKNLNTKYIFHKRLYTHTKPTTFFLLESPTSSSIFSFSTVIDNSQILQIPSERFNFACMVIAHYNP